MIHIISNGSDRYSTIQLYKVIIVSPTLFFEEPEVHWSLILNEPFKVGGSYMDRSQLQIEIDDLQVCYIGGHPFIMARDPIFEFSW